MMPNRSMLRYLILPIALLCLLPWQAWGADTVFNSSAVFRQELQRLGGEAKTYLASPVDTYPVETLLVLGALGLGFAADREVRSDLRTVRSAPLNRATDAGTFLGDPYLHIGVAAALYGTGALADAPRVMDLGAKLGEALVLADTTGFVLKEAIGRGRPETGTRNDRFRPFSFRSAYQSLPSMHTTSSFAVAHVLAAETESFPTKVLCYTLASFVGFSRLYQEKHWASDVILGAALGELAGSAVTRYRSGRLAVAPILSGGTPALALVGQF